MMIMQHVTVNFIKIYPELFCLIRKDLIPCQPNWSEINQTRTSESFRLGVTTAMKKLQISGILVFMVPCII